MALRSLIPKRYYNLAASIQPTTDQILILFANSLSHYGTIICLQTIQKGYNKYGSSKNSKVVGNNFITEADGKEFGCVQRISRYDYDTGAHFYHIVCSITEERRFKKSPGVPVTNCTYVEDRKAPKPHSEKYPNLCGKRERPFDEDLFSQPFALPYYEQAVYETFGGDCKKNISRDEWTWHEWQTKPKHGSVTEAGRPGAGGPGAGGPGATTEATTEYKTRWPVRTLKPKPPKLDRNYKILQILNKLIPMIHQAVDIAVEKKRKLAILFDEQYEYGNETHLENYTFYKPSSCCDKACMDCVMLLLVLLPKLFY